MVENHCNIKCETCSIESDSRPEGAGWVLMWRQRTGRHQPGREEAGGDKAEGHSLAEGAALQTPGGERDWGELAKRVTSAREQKGRDGPAGGLLTRRLNFLLRIVRSQWKVSELPFPRLHEAAQRTRWCRRDFPSPASMMDLQVQADLLPFCSALLSASFPFDYLLSCLLFQKRYKRQPR